MTELAPPASDEPPYAGDAPAEPDEFRRDGEHGP